MADISNKTLSVIVGLALVVSLVGLFSLPNGGLSGITGFASSGTGEARINITELAALNVTQTVIDFGNGTITEGFVNCTLASDVSGDPAGCFYNTTGHDGPQSGGLNVVNTGNVALNVTVTATKNATGFWGVAGGTYMYRCTGNGTSAQANYANIVQGTSLGCEQTLSATAGSDAFTLHVNITIPDTATGFKNDTLTFTGIKA